MAEIKVGHYVTDVPGDHIEVPVIIAPAAPPVAGEINDMKVAQKVMFKVAVPSITVSAIGVVGDLSVGISGNPFCKYLLKAYTIAIFVSLALWLGLLFLSVLFRRVPFAIRVAKMLAWTAVALVHIALGLKMTIHVIS